MSEKYYFTKKIDSEVLKEAVELRTSLRLELESISIKTNTDGTVQDDNIELIFSRALVSSELDEITTLVNAIDGSYDLMIRKNIERNTISPARALGVTVLDQFAANNLYRGKTGDEVDAIIENHAHLIHSLNTGSLGKAYREFLELEAIILGGGTVEGLEIEEIQEFKLRMEIILANL